MARLLRVVAGLVVCVSLSACGNNQPAPGPNPNPNPNPPATPPPPTLPPHDPVIEKELMITDLSVVNDARATGPDGVWSFGGLIEAMAGPTDPGRFVVNWLTTWDSNQTVNTFPVPLRQNIRSVVIDPWKAKDGQAGVSDAQWTPNLANAPFRLLAIVNRLDLNRGNGTTNVETAGEGRFVFGVLDASGNPLRFTVIFEYEQLAKDEAALRGWARSWHALGTLPFGDAYNAALQQITDKFSGKNQAPAKPNGSPLNQIRTNEIALRAPWELREFRIVNGNLKETPALQSPDNSLQNSPRLAKFVNDNEAKILARTFEVPAQFEGGAFLAGASTVPPGFFWQAPGISNNEARHILSVTACNGCHHRETNTLSFLHVANRAPNAQAALSGFLTGITVLDPVSGTPRPFNDLAERAELLKSIAEPPAAAAEAASARLSTIRRDRSARVH